MRRYLAAALFMVGILGMAWGWSAQAQTRRTIQHLKPQYSEKLPYGTVYVYCETSTGNRVYISPDDLFVLDGGCW